MTVSEFEVGQYALLTDGLCRWDVFEISGSGSSMQGDEPVAFLKAIGLARNIPEPDTFRKNANAGLNNPFRYFCFRKDIAKVITEIDEVEYTIQQLRDAEAIITEAKERFRILLGLLG